VLSDGAIKNNDTYRTEQLSRWHAQHRHRFSTCPRDSQCIVDGLAFFVSRGRNNTTAPCSPFGLILLSPFDNRSFSAPSASVGVGNRVTRRGPLLLLTAAT